VLKEQHQLFRSVLIASDAAFILAAQLVAYVLRFEVLPHDQGRYGYETHAIPLLLLPLMVVALFHAGLYHPRRDQRFVKEAFVIGRAVVIGTILIITAYYLFRKQLTDGRDLSNLQFALFGGLVGVSLLSWRFTFRSILKSLRRRGWNLRHVAIIGTGRLGQVVYHTLMRNSWTGIKPKFFVTHQENAGQETCCDLPVLGGLGDTERLLDEHDVSGVFIALPQRLASELPGLLSRLEKHPIDVRVVPDVNPRYTPFSMATADLEGMPILTVRQSPLLGFGRFWKRTVDLIGASVGLIVFSPLMLVIAVLVRLSGPGPVIFRQPRASLGGRQFMLYKFRTMRHVDAEQQAIDDYGKGTEAWTDPADDRITRIGRILRRTSLDELPQLFNVLLGEMSLVGPRPERPELIARFREDWRGYILRQHVKAGMTGWAQVNGLRGKSSLRKRLQYDLFYIRNWSLTFDLRILWLTIFKGFVHPNAH